MRLHRLVMLGCVGFFLSSVLVVAQPLPGGLPHTPPMPASSEDFQKALGLSADQQTKLSRLNQDFEKKIRHQFESLRPLQQQLETAVKAPSPDYKKIRQLLTQMSPQKIDIQVDTIRHSKQVENILTPEQREKLKALMSRPMR